MKNKFAYLLMGKPFDPAVHQATFETDALITYIFTVRSFDEACDKIISLEKRGVGVVELCGAFGEAGAKKLIELTNNKIAIGYVTHKSEQDHLFDAFFSRKSELTKETL